MFYLGLVGLGVLVCCVCVILAPHTTIFENDPRVIVDDYVDEDLDLNDTLRWLAYYNGAKAETNRSKLDFLVKMYLVAVASLGVIVIAFGLALAGRT